LLNRPDVNKSTIVMFIQEFSNCLSDKERNKVQTQLRMISQFSLKQITIDGFVDSLKIEVLDNDLKELKNNG